MRPVAPIAALIILQSASAAITAGAQTVRKAPINRSDVPVVAVDEHLSAWPIPDLLQRAASREAVRLTLQNRPSWVTFQPVPERVEQKHSWIKRHPVIFGAVVGFGAGYLVGYLPGDDGVFYDYPAEFNGLVVGGIGAGVGALAGWAASR